MADGNRRLVNGMSEENKKAMALGRERSRWVDAYIKALETHKYKGRGAQRPDSDDLKKRISELTKVIASSTGVEKVLRIQEKADLEKQLNSFTEDERFRELEARFLSVIKQFSLDRGVSFDSWRIAGVPVRTLAKAGMYPPKKRRSRAAEYDPDEME